jgi:TRAP-type C4-dicarboxylate transport system permease small subunit
MTETHEGGLIAAWDRLEPKLIGLLTLASLLLSFYSMVSRYIAPQYALDWTTEVVVYLITWAFFLAGARAIEGADHVKADLISNLVPERFRKYLPLFQDACAILFCVAVTIGGIQVVELSLRLGERSDSSLQLPMWIFYLSVPVAFASISFRYAVRLAGTVRALRRPGAEERG